MTGGLRVCVLLSAACLAGCGPRAAPPPRGIAPPAKRRAAVPRDDLVDSGWGTYDSPTFSLSIRLPRLRAWRIDERSERWLVATHAGSHSELRVRTWHAGRVVNRSDCERRARSWRKSIPAAAPESIVDQADSRVPEGFDTRVTVGVQSAQAQAGALDGYLLAFGGNVRRCIALVYTTRAAGPGAEEAIGRRLGIIAAGVAATLRLRGIEDRGPAAVPR